jgi:hypothetical protein
MSFRSHALVGPSVLLLLTVAMFWKLTLTNQYTWLNTPDLAHQVLPWFQFQSSQWRQGKFPLWDPYLWGGQPLIGQIQPGAVYPLNWILFLLPFRNGYIQQPFLNWYFVLIHYLGALFCYLLCRDLERSRTASILAGAGFAFGGYLATTDWPQMLNGAIWAPITFLFLMRSMRGERPLLNAALSGAFLGVSFLSGHHQIPIFISLAMGGTGIYYLFSAKRFARIRIASLLAVFLIFVFLISAAQTLPAYEYGRRAVRWVGTEHPLKWNERVPYFIHDQYGLAPLSILGTVVPGIRRHAEPFIGWVALSLAALALATKWNLRTVRILSAIALGGILLSLASFSVFHGILYA